MGKVVLLFIFCLYVNITAQSERFEQLNEKNVIGYAQPLATTLGTGINSAAFYSAYISSDFRISISIRGMLILVPDKQLTFTPDLPGGYLINNPAPTFWGQKGGTSYLGADGYIVMPGGINEQSIPLFLPQMAVSIKGTELMFRFIPKIAIGQEYFNFWGISLSHSISQYISSFPFNLALQVMYGQLKFSNIVDGKNYAFNVHASKPFGAFNLYSGLQYESSEFELNYTLKGDFYSIDPSMQINRKISEKIKGDNRFRFILGGALDFNLVILNADINLGSQIGLTSGLSFVF